MISFDLNRHFKNFSLNLFYNEKTYAQLLLDIESFSSFLSLNLSHPGPVALKVKSPYLAFVAILACIKENKSMILLSDLEVDSTIKKLQAQVFFENIIDDEKIKMSFKKDQITCFFPKINLDQEQIILFSSGTTKAPKGIAFSFNNFYYSAKGFAEFFNLTENDKSFMNLPHHHVGGLMILWRTFFSGGKVTTQLSSSLDFISLVPLQLKRMLSDPLQTQILKNIRVILIGGSRFQETLKLECENHGLNVFESYGMSESTSLVLANGKVLPYREIKLDEFGFFEIRGKTKALGFYEKNIFNSFGDGWLKTNDTGFQDSDGNFHFKERSDLIFISGGENINPLFVEELVKENPLIEEAFLIAIPDEKWGEMGILLYQGTPENNLSEEKIKSFLKTKIHPHHLPKFYFETTFNFENNLKPKRSDLKKEAYELYLKSIFSFDFFEIKDAPLIIFFHGFMGDKEDLKNISLPLQSQYSRLYLDLPGHGLTKIENFHSSSDVFNKLSAFISLFSNDPILFGYSMGGRLALHLALNYLTPKFLILESAGLGLTSPHEQATRKEKDFQQFSGINQNELTNFLNTWYENPLFQNYNTHPSYQQEMVKKSRHDFRQWRDSQNYLSSGCLPLMRENLDKISKSSFPLCYIYGELDSKYEDFANQIKLLKGKSYIFIEPILGAAHNPHFTHPSETTQVLTKHLK